MACLASHPPPCQLLCIRAPPATATDRNNGKSAARLTERRSRRPWPRSGAAPQSSGPHPAPAHPQRSPAHRCQSRSPSPPCICCAAGPFWRGGRAAHRRRHCCRGQTAAVARARGPGPACSRQRQRAQRLPKRGRARLASRQRRTLTTGAHPGSPSTPAPAPPAAGRRRRVRVGPHAGSQALAYLAVVLHLLWICGGRRRRDLHSFLVLLRGETAVQGQRAARGCSPSPAAARRQHAGTVTGCGRVQPLASSAHEVAGPGAQER